MNRSQLVSSIAAGVVLTSLIGGTGVAFVKARWLEPAAKLRADIETVRGRIDQYEQELAAASIITRDIDAFSARSLGADRETVDHELRTAIAEIARRAGLPEAPVSTGRQRTIDTPAKREFPRRGPYRTLREEPDLAELPATVSAEGTFPAILALVSGIAEAPWPKRIESIRLDARGAGDRLTARIGLVTAYIPGREPDGTPPALDPDPEIARAVGILAAGDRFRIPAPPPDPVVVAEAPVDPGPAGPPPPPPFPWHTWRLAGVASGPDGPEAWLEREGGERRVLTPGDRIHDAALESVALGDFAVVFAIGERRVRIPVGANLAPAATR